MFVVADFFLQGIIKANGKYQVSTEIGDFW
jgi:hypothetical protein